MYDEDLMSNHDYSINAPNLWYLEWSQLFVANEYSEIEIIWENNLATNVQEKIKTDAYDSLIIIDWWGLGIGER